MADKPTNISPLEGVFRFCDLPEELRQRIYELHLTTPEPVVISEIKKPNLGINLILACHKVHHEAKPILYGKNIFQLWSARTYSYLSDIWEASAGCHRTRPDNSVIDFIAGLRNHRFPPPITSVDIIIFSPSYFRGSRTWNRASTTSSLGLNLSM